MGVLTGLRVLELGRVAPMELPGMMLADMGADVVKIDTPAQTQADKKSRRYQRFSHTNRNKRSIALNLKSVEGLQVFLDLAKDADVIVEGFRPGVMERLGTSYSQISANNERLIYCSLSGFGQSGPYRDKPAHDLNFLALSGMIDLISKPGEMPSIPLNLVADFGGAAMHASLAITLALLDRTASGKGQFIDISYFDTTFSLLAACPSFRQIYGASHMPQAGEGIFCGGYPYYGLYRTKDGRSLSIACTEKHIWVEFCSALNEPRLIKYGLTLDHYCRSPNEQESAATDTIARILATKTSAEWQAHFSQFDVCVTPVKTVAETLSDAHVESRQLITGIDHAIDGFVPQFASPIRLSDTPPTIYRAAPLLGEHTREILTSLGLNDQRIDKMLATGVAGEADSGN